MAGVVTGYPPIKRKGREGRDSPPRGESRLSPCSFPRAEQRVTSGVTTSHGLPVPIIAHTVAALWSTFGDRLPLGATGQRRDGGNRKAT